MEDTRALLRHTSRRDLALARVALVLLLSFVSVSVLATRQARPVDSDSTVIVVVFDG
jgi:hypothetical protein